MKNVFILPATPGSSWWVHSTAAASPETAFAADANAMVNSICNSLLSPSIPLHEDFVWNRKQLLLPSLHPALGMINCWLYTRHSPGCCAFGTARKHLHLNEFCVFLLLKAFLV